MASGQTENYGLNQWAAEDAVLREEFNRDNAALDTVLSEMGTRIPRFMNGSYTGTGTYGPDGPCVLHFGFQPKMVFLNVQEMHSFNSQTIYYILFPGMTWFPEPNSGSPNHLTWLEDGISWYFSSSGDNAQTQARKQYNTLGETYSYVAITW